MKRCTECGRIPFFCKCQEVKEAPTPLKSEMLEPFLSLERKGVRPIIGFTQTQYQGRGKIYKRFYAGYTRIEEGGEKYVSVGDDFDSATSAMEAIINKCDVHFFH